MHRNRQPDCLKAYLQLSNFKKKKSARHPNTRCHKEKNERTKKHRVEKGNDNSGSPNVCDISPSPNLTNSNTRQVPNPHEDDESFSETLFEDTEDADLERGNMQSVEAAGKEVGTSNGIQESNHSDTNMMDMHTPDPSLLKLYNDINSVLYVNNELPQQQHDHDDDMAISMLESERTHPFAITESQQSIISPLLRTTSTTDDLSQIIRTTLADKPRVTRFAIPWQSNQQSQEAYELHMDDDESIHETDGIEETMTTTPTSVLTGCATNSSTDNTMAMDPTVNGSWMARIVSPTNHDDMDF